MPYYSGSSASTSSSNGTSSSSSVAVVGKLKIKTTSIRIFILTFKGLDHLLRTHLQQLRNVDVYRIPNQTSSSFDGHQFLQRHLQHRGLDNDGAVCGLLNAFLVFHRMNLTSFFVDAPQISTNNSPDFPILILLKILKALPSLGPFSIQLFVQSWNSSATLQNGRANLGVNDDILVCDNVMRSLVPYFRIGNRPVLTKYTAKYRCNVCAMNFTNISLDDNVGFSWIPLLDVPDCRGISPGQMLTSLLSRPINFNCVQCNNRICATMEAEKGRFTVLALNRTQFDGNNAMLPKVMTKLTSVRATGVGETLCGDLISCISHIGSQHQGHWVSYHKTSNSVWWKNNDSYPVVQTCHPFNVNNREETVNFVVFKND